MKNATDNCIANKCSWLMNEWDYEKNTLSPYEVSYGSKKKAWWVCEKGHSWDAVIYSRTKNHGCPYCSGRSVSSENSLVVKSPITAREWHPIRNNISANEVSYASNRKAWWLCNKCKHEWYAQIGNRCRGSGCPNCDGSILSAINNLAFKAPHLVVEWHPTKNDNKTPHEVFAGTKDEYWWLCEKGHSWQASCLNRYNGTGCPDCSNKRLSQDNNLAAKAPHLIAEWHRTRNGDLTPYDITPNTSKKVWWTCKNGHDAHTSVRSRFIGGRCAKCTGRTVSHENNLAVKFPKIVVEWHPTKNGSLTPYDVTPGSKIKCWWICILGHEWRAPVHVRTSLHGCPKCNIRASRLEIRLYSEIKYIFPDAIWQDKSYGREIDILLPSNKIAIEIDGWWWHRSSSRELADHRKSLLLKSHAIALVRLRDDRLCNISGEYILLYKNGENDLKVVMRVIQYLKNNFYFAFSETLIIDEYLKSFSLKNEKLYAELIESLPIPREDNALSSKPLLLVEFDVSKNRNVNPRNISTGSKVKYWWICKFGHSWLATMGSRSAGRNCPYCSGKKPCATNNIAVKAPHLIPEWHPTNNGNLTPFDFTPYSSKKVWWQCANGHCWEAVICNRVKNNTGCPDCSGKILSQFHNLAAKHPELIKEWHDQKNGELTPYDVTPHSSKKVWWHCNAGHEWEASVTHRARGHGCHYCSGYKK